MSFCNLNYINGTLIFIVYLFFGYIKFIFLITQSKQVTSYTNSVSHDILDTRPSEVHFDTLKQLLLYIALNLINSDYMAKTK